MTSKGLLGSTAFHPEICARTQDHRGWRKGIDSGFRCKVVAIGMDMGERSDSGSAPV